MAQLFTVYFPKYHFILPREFTIAFPQPLPFSYTLSKDHNMVFVEEVHYEERHHSEEDIESWKREGLQPGLRIVKINDKTLVDDEDEDDIPGQVPLAGTTSSFPPPQRMEMSKSTVTAQQFNDLVINLDTEKEIQFTFREEIMFIDNSVALGLEYKLEQEMKSNDSLSAIRCIGDHQISVSSFEENHDSTQCRLNNPNNYWSPTTTNERTRDVWICFDLRMKKYVDKIYIQGSPDHQQYVTSLRIDYSQDGCQWRSHSLNAIACKYQSMKSASTASSSSGLPATWLSTIHSNVEDDDVDDSKSSVMNAGHAQKEAHTAVIYIWPMIHAQFVRIRPYEWFNRIAMRVELFGPPKEKVEFGRIVTMTTVNQNEKSRLMDVLRGKPTNTKVIQVDCKAVVSAALDRAGCLSYAVLSADKEHHLCVFTTPNADTSERAMDQLAEAGVGTEIGEVSASSIVYRNAPKSSQLQSANSETKTGFYSSIKSRMAVKQVVERIINSAAFTFDYVCMLTVASLIAVGGLATGSAVIVVASMLVSPIMGPVLALTFGATLREKNMTKLGIFNELLSLLGCVVIGFIVGFFYSWGTKNRNAWPTQEMWSRGQLVSLADGAFIAAASGVGVALSVLGDYLSTVVGVAISASLLPPAVNCGMLLSFVLYEIAFPEYVHQEGFPEYNQRDTLIMSAISLILTIENIIIIFIAASLMFVVKNVYISKDHNASLWRSVTNFKSEYSKMRQLENVAGGVQRAIKRRRSRSPYANNQSMQAGRGQVNPYKEGDTGQFKYEYSHSDGSVDNIHVYSKTGSRIDRCVESIKPMFSEDTLTGSVRGSIMRRQSLYFQANPREQANQQSPARKLKPTGSGRRYGENTSSSKKQEGKYSKMESVEISPFRQRDRTQSLSEDEQRPLKTHRNVMSIFPDASSGTDESALLQSKEPRVSKHVSVIQESGDEDSGDAAL